MLLILFNKTNLYYFILLCLFSGMLVACNDNSTGEGENTLTAVVNDPTGLSVFDETSYNSRKIIKIAYQEQIILLEDTKKSDEVVGVKGTWFKIRYKNIEGFAFSGFFEVKEGESNVNSASKDIFRGTMYSGGTSCNGLTYSEYGSLIVFKDNNQVQYFQFDMGYGKLSKGVYELKEDKIILKLRHQSVLTESYDPDVTQKPSPPQISQKVIDEIQIYNKSNCESKFALRREGDELTYIDFSGDAETRSYLLNSYEMIERHINIVSTASSNSSKRISPPPKENSSSYQPEYSNLSGVYVSYEEGIEERIYLEVDSRQHFNIFYKSPKYQNKIRLNVRNVNLQTQSCEVSFPNEPKTYYKMHFDINSATCTYPSGYVQQFEMQ